MYFVFILGPAGSGKSYLTRSFCEWIRSHRMEAIAVNMDPAAEWLPYSPDVDIRDYITASDVMKKYNLGPNGGLIMSVDLSVNYIDKIREEIESYHPNYVIVDTPGQLEIFAFRAAGPTIVSSLIQGCKAVAVFLIDSYLATKPSSFLSLILLALSTSLRHGLPQIHVLSKADVLSEEEIERILGWIENPESLTLELGKEEPIYTSQIDLAYAFETMIRSMFSQLIPVSAVTWEGLDQLYAEIQRHVAGGEDYLTEEPSEAL